MDKNRYAERQLVSEKRDCAMGVMTFDQFNWTEYQASIVDINRNGVGIESNSLTGPGFVWFRDPIWGQQSGVLLWSKQVGNRYRSGIRFASLPSDAEAYVKNQVAGAKMHEPLKDLEKNIKLMVESIKGDIGLRGGMTAPPGEDGAKSSRPNND